MIELLAPAGDLEKLKFAYIYGADAVYAGTAKLSLRTRAEMNSDTLHETIEYAHSIGKKVYVALNIYARDNDYSEIEEEIKKLNDIKADEYPDGFTSMLILDMDAYAEKYGEKAVRKNCTIPAWLNTQAERAGINFSKILQEALIKKLNI